MNSLYEFLLNETSQIGKPIKTEKHLVVTWGWGRWKARGWQLKGFFSGAEIKIIEMVLQYS